jgi:hypothetical protein
VSSSRRWIDPEHRLDYLAGLGIRRDHYLAGLGIRRDHYLAGLGIRRDHYLAGLGIRRDLPAFNSLLDDEAI